VSGGRKIHPPTFLFGFLSVAIAGCGIFSLASPIAASAAAWSPARVEGRLWLGHDSNLLDLSDVDRGLFGRGDPSAFFAVDRMSDQFWEGELRGEWRAPKSFLRPSLTIGWERLHYLHNPIRSEDVLSLGLRVRPAEKTRVDIETLFRPQVYSRHRWYADAFPGEPQFRPEAYRRWDLDGIVRQALDAKTTADVRLESSWRRYQAPFEGRDRTTFGGGGGLSRSLGRKIDLRAGVRYRATWTRNDPWDPDDRSYRAWRASSKFTMGRIPFLQSGSIGLDLEWRRFTSTDPDDQDHFGRRDWGGEAEVELSRGVTKSLDWVSRATWRWRRSNFPEAVFDEEGDFEDSVYRTGVIWGWSAP
jgi:hypothetical protein